MALPFRVNTGMMNFKFELLVHIWGAIKIQDQNYLCFAIVIVIVTAIQS